LDLENASIALSGPSVRSNFASLKAPKTAVTGTTELSRKQNASKLIGVKEAKPASNSCGQLSQNRSTEKPEDAEVEVYDIHHIPPRHPRPYIRKRVSKKVHQAYHWIFGSSPSLAACIEILKRDWWPESTGDSNF
jgi:hypothetical protein